ncbi:hypothetical protein ACOMHN_010714 [Nucella lapillus]
MYSFQVELFPNWTTKDPKDLVITHRFYLYSAIVNIYESPRASYHGTAIHIVGFQDERSYTKLKCCLKLSNSDHVQSGGMATIDHQFPSDRNTHLKTFGMVYRCVFPNTSQQLRGGHVTLSPTSCPGDLKQYLTIHHPEVKPGGLAICAKVAYGFQLNLDVLVEWLELQRILGVDKIQLFDLNNTEVVHKVFRHYQDMGLLEIMPYKLPGKTWGRSMLKNGTDYANFGDDEELVNWECRLRLAGYDYVMHLDMDEVLMPRHFKALKPYLKQEFAQYPGAASVHFHRLLFLVDWQPADPKTSLHFLRYLNYMDSPDDAGKHVYIPRRTHQTYTHGILPYMGFRSIWFIKNTVASVFHYRTCKMNWEFNCKVPGTPNTAMLRFSNELVLAVSSAREQLGLHPLKQGGQVA